MAQVVAFPTARPERTRLFQRGSATVIILPVIRIERYVDDEAEPGRRRRRRRNLKAE